ncbi:4-cresol dehydrogenase (hydroxylating) [Nitrosomonas sp. Nm51]|uniref:FAD-binding oxidoreductase n=1 Tax=Nitrosomonas sp. Nm51 TaxID=133720 RepID=UPI0008B03719|nr:FAD-binding oxidoreductase [Nitrosomonas sp. Nm51]SER34370.1 4-cresol dehydrogenase (hydroxylating) [Nitrosomonas sp. Nm51]
MENQNFSQTNTPLSASSNLSFTLNEETFEQAVYEMRSVIGENNVITGGNEFNSTARATIPEPKSISAVIRPGNTNEVMSIIRISQQFGLPIWPVSQGKNWGYGSATPVLNKTAVLKLDRMNRILEINEELAYAVIEPGVTYRQLRQFLQENHPGLWSDSTDGPPDGSVIGNALDRGLGVTHYADHFGTLCGLEVVLPTGELLQTGGGPTGCRTWHTHKWGVGPSIDGLFSQSNFGIVTKAGIWLMPKPEKFVSFTFDLYEESNLPQLIDALRELALKNILQSATHIANDVVALSVLDQYPASLLREHSRLPPEILATLCNAHGIKKWTFGGGIQGTASQIRIVKQELKKKIAKMGCLTFIDDKAAAVAGKLAHYAKQPFIGKIIAATAKLVTGRSVSTLEAAPYVHSVLQGIPSDFFVRHAYFKSDLPKPEISNPDRDNCGLIWFAPIAPMKGQYVEEILEICRPLFERYDFDFYVALLVQNARSMIVLMSIFFRKEDETQVENAKQLYAALNKAVSQAGFQQYRIGVNGMTELVKTAPDFIHFLSKIKSCIDPSGILAPGKYGIYKNDKNQE